MNITAVMDGVVRETFPKCIDFLYGDKYNGKVDYVRRHRWQAEADRHQTILDL